MIPDKHLPRPDPLPLSRPTACRTSSIEKNRDQGLVGCPGAPGALHAVAGSTPHHSCRNEFVMATPRSTTEAYQAATSAWERAVAYVSRQVRNSVTARRAMGVQLTRPKVVNGGPAEVSGSKD